MGLFVTTSFTLPLEGIGLTQKGLSEGVGRVVDLLIAENDKKSGNHSIISGSCRQEHIREYVPHKAVVSRK